MATYYMDTNGTTAGFGTLTNSTPLASAIWTTSAAGTTPAPVVWDLATVPHAINFGSSSVATTVPGTLTIPAGQTLSVSSITAANLGATSPTINGLSGDFIGQYIAGSTGTLLFASASNSITLPSTRSVFFGAPVTLAAGNSLTINSALVVNFGNTNHPDMAGTINANSTAILKMVNNVAGQSFFASGSTINVASTAILMFQRWVSGATCTINSNISGAGIVRLQNDANGPNDVTFSGSFSSFTGTIDFFTGGGVARISSPPVSGAIRFGISTAAYYGGTVFFNVSSAGPYLSGGIDFGGSGSSVYSNGSSPITISGNVNATAAINVRGTTLGNIFSGSFTRPSGTFSINKTDAGSWIASGSGLNINGGITVTQGSWIAANGAVTDGTSAVTVPAGGTLGLSGGITNFNAPINLTGTLNNVSGANTYPSTLTLAANSAVIRAESGTLTKTGTNTFSTFTLTIGNASDTGLVILGGTTTGSGQMTKVGPSGFAFTGTTNSHTGNVVVSAGYYEMRAGVTSAAFPSGTLSLTGTGAMRFSESSLTPISFNAKGVSIAAGVTGAIETGSMPNSVFGDFGSIVTLTATSTLVLQGANTNNNTLSTVFAGSAAAGITKSGVGKWVLTAANDLTGTTNVNEGTLVVSNASYTNKLAGGTVNVNQGGRLQTGIAGTQKGRCTYNTLKLNGAPGTPARLRIGGSVASPTTYLSGNLTLPTSGATTWDVSAYSQILKTPGTYTLIAWTTAAGQIAAGDVTTNVTLTGLPAGMTATLAYDSVSVPRRITITTSY